MLEVAPDLFNASPVHFTETTHDALQRARDVTDLLDSLTEAEDNGLTEEDALAIAENAFTVLDRVGTYERTLTDQWDAEAESIDPQSNLSGFLAWDGVTEPEQMRTFRRSRRLLESTWTPLSMSIINFVINTYARHHVCKPGTENWQSLTKDFRAQVIYALQGRNELPFSPKASDSYGALIADTARTRNEHFGGILDILSEQTRGMQQARREFDPAFVDTKKTEVTMDASQLKSQIDGLWNSVLQPDEQLEQRWEDLREALLALPIQPTADQDIRSVVDDAVRLLARIEPSLRITTPWEYEKRGYLLHGLLKEEQGHLVIASRILRKAGQIEGFGGQLTSLNDLSPRLYNSVLYLYAQSEFIDALTGGMETIGSITSIGLQTFLRRALTGTDKLFDDRTMTRPTPPIEVPVSVSEAVRILSLSES